MAAFSDYLEAELLNHTLRNVAYTSPTTVYLALFTSATADDGTGTEVTAGGNSYVRQAITFGAPSGGSVANTSAVEFVDMPGAVVTHMAIYDASTNGNMLYHGALTASKTVNAGDTLTFPVGDLTVTLS